MSFRRLLVWTALGAVFLWPHAGQAQAACSARTAALEYLAENYHEAPVARGVLSSGQVIELLLNETGGFTIILTLPDGQSCLVGAGEGWQFTIFTPPKKGEGT